MSGGHKGATREDTKGAKSRRRQRDYADSFSCLAVQDKLIGGGGAQVGTTGKRDVRQFGLHDQTE
jgi:hypothetical protein